MKPKYMRNPSPSVRQEKFMLRSPVAERKLTGTQTFTISPKSRVSTNMADNLSRFRATGADSRRSQK